jgi:hypothetical protein
MGVGRLGNALEAMATCDRRWPSLHGDLYCRLDERLQTAAQLAEQEARGIRPQAAAPPGAPFRREVPAGPAERRGLLHAVPGSARVDWYDSAAVTIVAGEQWRRRRLDGRVEGSRPSERGTTLLALRFRGLTLVRPWQVLSYLDFSVGGALEREGRPATRLRAVPRGGDFRGMRQLHGLPIGDGYDLVVDDATGVLLELVSWTAGQEIERLALHGVRVGEPVEDGLFALDAAGQADEAEPASRTFRPLPALAAQVDFTLLAPVDEAYLGVVEHHENGAMVAAHPYGGRPLDRLLWYRLSRGAGLADPAGWQEAVLADGTPARWWASDSDPDRGHLRFERAGTQVWLQGDRDEAYDLAGRLRPLSG